MRAMRVTERFKQGITRYVPDDRDDLAEFQRNVFGHESRQLDPERFAWIYERNPAQHDDEPGVWVARRNDAVVGQQAEIPFDVKVGAGTHPAGWTVDLIVDPEWRIKGIGPGLVVTHAEHRGLLAAVTQSEEAVRLYERLAWTEVATIPSYTRPVDMTTTLRFASVPHGLRRLAPLLAVLLRLVDIFLALAFRAAGLRFYRVRRFDEKVDEVWEHSSPDHQVLALRDGAHARWRFDDCPEADELQRYYLTRGKRTLGYVVLQAGERWDQPATVVVDYLAPTRWVVPLLTFAAHEARRQGSFALICRTLNRRADQWLRYGLFLKRGMGVASPLRLIVHCTLPDAERDLVSDPESWLLTSADSDLS
jgi:GNAT superfamily N-acetyltransferase